MPHLISCVVADRVLGDLHEGLTVLARYSGMLIGAIEQARDAIEVVAALAAVQVIVTLPAHIVRANRLK